MSRFQSKRTERRANFCMNKIEPDENPRRPLSFPETIGRDILRIFNEQIEEDIRAREIDEHYPEEFDEE